MTDPLPEIKSRHAARQDWVEDAEDGIGRCRHCGRLQTGQPIHNWDCPASEEALATCRPPRGLRTRCRDQGREAMTDRLSAERLDFIKREYATQGRGDVIKLGVMGEAMAELVAEVERLQDEHRTDKARIKALEDALVPFVALHPERFRSAADLFETSDPPEGERP